MANFNLAGSYEDPRYRDPNNLSYGYGGWGYYAPNTPVAQEMVMDNDGNFSWKTPDAYANDPFATQPYRFNVVNQGTPYDAAYAAYLQARGSVLGTPGGFERLGDPNNSQIGLIPYDPGNDLYKNLVNDWYGSINRDILPGTNYYENTTDPNLASQNWEGNRLRYNYKTGDSWLSPEYNVPDKTGANIFKGVTLAALAAMGGYAAAGMAGIGGAGAAAGAGGGGAAGADGAALASQLAAAGLTEAEIANTMALVAAESAGSSAITGGAALSGLTGYGSTAGVGAEAGLGATGGLTGLGELDAMTTAGLGGTEAAGGTVAGGAGVTGLGELDAMTTTGVSLPSMGGNFLSNLGAGGSLTGNALLDKALVSAGLTGLTALTNQGDDASDLLNQGNALNRANQDYMLNWWQQNAFPNAERLGAMRDNAMGSLNASSLAAQQSFAEDMAKRGIKGGGLMAGGMADIERGKQKAFGNLSNELIQFANTPMFTPSMSPITSRVSGDTSTWYGDLSKSLLGQWAGNTMYSYLNPSEGINYDELAQAFLRAGGR